MSALKGNTRLIFPVKDNGAWWGRFGLRVKKKFEKARNEINRRMTTLRISIKKYVNPFTGDKNKKATA